MVDQEETGVVKEALSEVQEGLEGLEDLEDLEVKAAMVELAFQEVLVALEEEEVELKALDQTAACMVQEVDLEMTKTEVS